MPMEPRTPTHKREIVKSIQGITFYLFVLTRWRTKEYAADKKGLLGTNVCISSDICETSKPNETCEPNGPNEPCET